MKDGYGKKAATAVAAAAVIAAWLVHPDPAVRSHEVVGTTIAFDREISRILTRRCITCHAPGRLSFPLTSYEETRPWARAIQEEILTRRMPPWRAVRGHGEFSNDGALTTRERDTVLAWIAGNGPKTRGQLLITGLDDERTPEAERLRPEPEGWRLGTPDLIRPVVATSGGRVMVTLGPSASLRLRAVEFKPAHNTMARAVTIRREDGQWLGTWTPWHPGAELPPDAAHLFAPNSRVVLEMFPASAADANEVGQLGAYFADADSDHCSADILLNAVGTAPARSVGWRSQASVTLRANTTLIAFAPELTPGVRTVEVRAQQPDGISDVLLLVRDILHDWPTPYVLSKPRLLRPGTTLTVTAYSDNHSDESVAAGVHLRVTTASQQACRAQGQGR